MIDPEIIVQWSHDKPRQTQQFTSWSPGLQVQLLSRYLVPAVSRLEIRIFTGRQHQIRAHCAHVGHPVLTDGALEAIVARLVSPKLDVRSHQLHFWVNGYVCFMGLNFG